MKPHLLAVALLLAGCAQVPPQVDAAAAARLGPATGAAQRCIALPAGEGLTALGDGMLGYRSGSTLWVSHMPGQCRTSSLGTIIIERNGSQVCRGDRIRMLETGSTIAGAACTLGDFVPHSAL